MRVTSMLERLQDHSASDRLHLQQSLVEFGEAADEDYDVQDANNPLMDKVIEEAGDEAFRVLTNFTPSEFDIIWANVERAMNLKWFEGRGRKSKMTPKDAFYVTLTVLKHFQSWEKHAVDFNLKAHTLEKIVVKVVELCSPILYDTFVTMPTIMSLGRKFVHYPYALYATDVKFQPSHRPSGRFGEQKHYFSGKHKLYGLKIEASVSPDGRLVDMSPYVPGSVADLTLIRSRLDEHQRFLSKEASESIINDNGELFRDHPNSWALLVDKGYIGLAASLRAIHPKKKPTGGALDRHDLDRNKEVSSDRVIVENFFGRVSMLWKVSYATFVWGEKLYDDIQRLTFSLTNFHASLLPLRLEDHDSYRAVMARYKRMAAENTTKRAAAQRRYVQRRAERLAASAARADRVVFTSPSANRRR